MDIIMAANMDRRSSTPPSQPGRRLGDRGRGQRQHDGAALERWLGTRKTASCRALVARGHGSGGRNVEVDDDKYGFVASLDLNPQKARVLLRLSLLDTTDPRTIQGYFDAY